MTGMEREVGNYFHEVLASTHSISEIKFLMKFWVELFIYLFNVECYNNLVNYN